MRKFATWWRHWIRNLSCRIAAITVLAVCSALIMGFTFSSINTVTIRDGLSTSVIRTTSSDVMKILKQSGIELDEGESAESDGPIDDFGHITILRNFPVTISIDGEKRTVMTNRGTVNSLLAQQNIKLGPHDQIDVGQNSQVYSGMQINIICRNIEIIEEEVAIPHAVKRIESQQVPRGKSVVTQKGKDGVKKVVKQIEYKDGQQIKTTVLSETVLAKPVDSIVKYGIGGSLISRGGETLRYSHYIDVTATAYTYGEGGPHGDVTASGKAVRVGFVAVDPRVIPLGTRVYITSPSGEYVYGYAVAEDTGGAIKGNKIDLFMNTPQECKSFGKRKMRVYIID